MTIFVVDQTMDVQSINSRLIPGDTVIFASGLYNISASIVLRSGVSYVGSAGAVLNSASSSDIMYGNGVSNVTVTGLTFSGGPNVSDGAHAAIHLIDVNNVSVTSNSFENINADAAILLYQSDNVSITDNTGTNLREFVSAINNSGAHGNIAVSGNTLLNTSRMGVEVQGSYSHLAVDDNSITNTGSIGISLVGGQAATDVSVEGNTLSGGVTAVETSDADMTVTGNVISNMVGGMSIANTPGSVFYDNSFTGVSIPFGQDGGYTGVMSVGSDVINGVAVNGWTGHPNAAAVPDLAAGSDAMLPMGVSGGAVPSGVTGPDSIDLTLAEDAWGGDASFTVQVNGMQVGGVRTVTASHAAGISQDVVLSGNWGTGAQAVGISFINDAFGGTASTDRNLYVNAVSYDGQMATPGATALFYNETAQFQTKPAGSGTATLLLAAGSQGGAGYAVAVDGKTVIAQGFVPASGTAGLTQEVNLPGLLGAGWHDVAVSLLGAAAGGLGAGASLSVKGVAVNNVTSAGSSALLTTPQTDHFAILVPS